MSSANFKNIDKTIEILSKFNKVLFLTCSNRYSEIEEKQTPKSTILAEVIADKLDNVTLINVPELKIYPCEGNVSREDGNKCGIKDALLKDKEKNPSGYHRCWASIHNEDDELWKISKELFESDCVIFFASVRWGQANMFYQKLMERLNWINNRFVPLGENNIVKDITSGLIIIGQHYGAEQICELQFEIHKYYGFEPNKNLYWYWNCDNIEYNEETLEQYKKSYPKFYKTFKIEKL